MPRNSGAANPWSLLKYYVVPSRLSIKPDDILPLGRVSLEVSPGETKPCFKCIGGPPGWIEGIGLHEEVASSADRYHVMAAVLGEFDFAAGWFATRFRSPDVPVSLHTYDTLVEYALRHLLAYRNTVEDQSVISLSSIAAALRRMHRYGVIRRTRVEHAPNWIDRNGLEWGYTIDLSRYQPLYIDAPTPERIWGKAKR